MKIVLWREKARWTYGNNAHAVSLALYHVDIMPRLAMIYLQRNPYGTQPIPIVCFMAYGFQWHYKFFTGVRIIVVCCVTDGEQVIYSVALAVPYQLISIGIFQTPPPRYIDQAKRIQLPLPVNGAHRLNYTLTCWTFTVYWIPSDCNLQIKSRTTDVGLAEPETRRKPIQNHLTSSTEEDSLRTMNVLVFGCTGTGILCEKA